MCVVGSKWTEDSCQRALLLLQPVGRQMLGRFFLVGLAGLALVAAAARGAAQEFDAVISAQNRSRATVADQISDPAERKAFLGLYKETNPSEKLRHAQAFLTVYPQSAFLAQVYEIAARSSFDLEDYRRGLDYAKESLELLPENPLLLVVVADVEARQGLAAEAVEMARNALVDLDRFVRPSSVSEREWPDLMRQLKASSYFALGRALLVEALNAPPGEDRGKLLKQSNESLSRARVLNTADAEIAYLMGLASLSLGKPDDAAKDFATVYRQKGPFESKALEHLQTIHATLHPHHEITFDTFLQRLERQDEDLPLRSPAKSSAPAPELPAYAGSQTCRLCHTDICEAWSHTGMARMFRPYRPENVIGDFQKNNEFLAGDEDRLENGKLQVIPAKGRFLFARMVIRDGRHYFDIRQSDGQWHSYPVDYTIGSKWQQAYATRLPNGQIHVFPIQYNALHKRWINFWKIIDAPGGARADVHNWEKFDASTSYQTNCAVCHTSQLRNVKGGGFEPDDLEFREPGIACEMCHGPSARHVASMQAAELYEKRPLDPPVDFSKTSSRDFLAICSQCHMQSAFRKAGPHGELNYSRAGEFFVRDESVPFGEFSRKGFYRDGRFRQTTFIVESLERSECFKKGQATCGSCHDPHGHDAASNPKSLKFRDQPDQMCVQCHTRFKDKPALSRHTRHHVNSDGSRCVSCHMPRIMEALLFRARTHRIDDIPNADMTLRFGQEESPNACLLCHSNKDALWVKRELVAWRGNP